MVVGVVSGVCGGAVGERWRGTETRSGTGPANLWGRAMGSGAEEDGLGFGLTEWVSVGGRSSDWVGPWVK